MPEDRLINTMRLCGVVNVTSQKSNMAQRIEDFTDWKLVCKGPEQTFTKVAM